jgi:hypothetical protein
MISSAEAHLRAIGYEERCPPPPAADRLEDDRG